MRSPRPSPPLAFAFPASLSPNPAALAAAGAVALVALAATPAHGQTPPAAKVASFGAGDSLDVDLGYESRWEASSYIDPLKLSGRLRVEVVRRAEGGDPALPEGTLEMRGRLDVKRVDYERPDRKWSLTPLSTSFGAVAASLHAATREEPPAYARRLALAEELLGAATVAARGRPFAIVLPPWGPARVTALDGERLAPGLPLAADHVLSGFLAGSARFVLPERGPVIETEVAGQRRMVTDAGTAEYYRLVGLNPEAAARPVAVPGPQKLVTRRLDGIDMRVAGVVPSAKGGRAQVTEAPSGTDGADASLLPFTLLGALGTTPSIRPDAGETMAGAGGAPASVEAPPAAPDPMDLALRIRPQDRRVSITSRVVANEALGFAVRRQLRLDEKIVGTPHEGSRERVQIEGRVSWSASLSSVRIGARKKATPAPAPRPQPKVEP